MEKTNDSVGPDGFVPTLLVYGALYRLGLAHDAPNATMQQRAAATQIATEEISKLFARRQVTGALKTRKGPDKTSVHGTPVGSPLLVNRIFEKKCTGPFKLLAVFCKTHIVAVLDGSSKFRTTVVKPYIGDERLRAIYSYSLSSGPMSTCVSCFIKYSSEPNFEAARQAEMNRLFFIDVFITVDEKEAAANCIFRWYTCE